MHHTVHVIFGKEQVLKVSHGEPLSDDERQLYEKVFEFQSLQEKHTFIQGLNEALGWQEIFIPELECVQD